MFYTVIVVIIAHCPLFRQTIPAALRRWEKWGIMKQQKDWEGMETELRLERAKREDKRAVKDLYLRAFPPEERPPFGMLWRRAARGKGELLAAWDGTEFVGLVSLLGRGDVVYLFYLAIDENRRGAGYGSAILALVRQRCEGKRLFLARETLDPAAENYDQRLRRHRFYLRNGFSDLPLRLREGQVVYDVMGTGGLVSGEEYRALMDDWAGWLGRFVKMELWSTEEGGGER